MSLSSENSFDVAARRVEAYMTKGDASHEYIATQLDWLETEARSSRRQRVVQRLRRMLEIEKNRQTQQRAHKHRSKEQVKTRV